MAILNKFLDFKDYKKKGKPERIGHMSTNILFASNRKWYFDDESSALALIWRVKLVNMGMPVDGGSERRKWQDVLDFVQSHDQEGYYVNKGKGKERSWFDTFVFPEDDVVTYNQGIYGS